MGFKDFACGDASKVGRLVLIALLWILGILFILAAVAMNNEWFAETALAEYFVRNLTMQTVDYVIGGVFALLGLIMCTKKWTICRNY